MNKNESSIVIYRHLVKIRDFLKDIQQLSWNINQFDRKYPLETAPEETYPELLKTYKEFLKQVEVIASSVKEDAT